MTVCTDPSRPRGRALAQLGRSAALLLGLSTAPLAQSVEPALLQGKAAEVLVFSVGGRDLTADDARLGQLITACRATLEISASDSARFVQHRPVASTPDAALSHDALVLSVIPRLDATVACNDASQQTLAASRGLRVALDGPSSDPSSVERVIVRRGDRVLRPLLDEELAVERLGAGGFTEHRGSGRRLVFARGDFAPGSSNAVDDLTVEVVSSTVGEGERLSLPWDAVRVAWESSLRARPAPASDATAPGAIALARPNEERLGPMNEAYSQGEPDRALKLAVPYLLDPTLPREVRRDARLHAVMSLLALGDTASARVVTATLLQDAPCLSIDATAPLELQRFFGEGSRSRVGCAARSPTRAGVSALLLPGFGLRRSDPLYEKRLLVFLGSAGLGAVALQLNGIAKERFETYRGFEGDPIVPGEANELYREAVGARRKSVAVAVAGAIVWIGQGFYAYRAERRLAEELRPIQGLGRSPAVRLRPQSSPDGLGLALSWHW